jgi:predicted amidohydrolase YtcJ
VTALAALAVLAAACGGSSPVLIGTTAYQKALAYAQCMRAHGEPSYPDPTSNGGFIIDGKKDHLNGQLMQSANKTCQHLLPKTPPMTAAQQRQVTAQALKYVACMRTHGIPDMPDPVVNAQGVEFRIGGPKGKGPPPGSPVLQNAMRACQKLLPGGPP